MLPALFNATASLLPSVSGLRAIVSTLGDANQALQLATASAQKFYGVMIGSNLELQQMVRQSSIVIAAQSEFFTAGGKKIENFSEKMGAVSADIARIQREIEIETRAIVGATDTQTNAILNQVTSNFGQLRGQTKKYANELDGVTKLVTNLTSAFNTFQLPDYQIPQEIKSLLRGDINNPDSILAQQLKNITGLTSEAVAIARSNGTFYDLLIEKTEAFADANKSGAETIQNSLSVIKDVTSQLMRETGEDPTEGLRKGLAGIQTLLNDLSESGILSKIATAFGGPIGDAIEVVFAKATAAVRMLGESTNTDQLIDKISLVSTAIGDVIKVIGDIAITAGLVIGKTIDLFAALGKTIAFALGDKPPVQIEVEGTEKLDDIERRMDQKWYNTIFAEVDTLGLDKFNSMLEKSSFKKKIDLDTPQPERYQKIINQLQKDLDSEGPIKKAIDFILTPLSVNTLFFGRGGQIDDIKNSAKSVSETFQSELEKNIKQAKQLELQAPKIAALNVSSIENFTADLSKPLSDNIAALSSNIEWGSLSKEVSTKIREQLAAISSSSEISAASKDIASTIKSDIAGGFDGTLNGMKAQYDAIKQARDELIASGKEGNFDVSAEATVFTQQMAQIQAAYEDVRASADSQVVAQRKVVESLVIGSDEYKKAKEVLDKYEESARNANGIEAVGKDAISQGNALVSTYSKLTGAAQAFADTTGDDATKIKADFEALIKEVTTASQLGVMSTQGLINILKSAASSDLQSTEERVKALQLINTLIDKETQLRKALNDVSRAENANLLQRGELSKTEAALSNNKLDTADLLVKLEGLQTKQLISQESLRSSANEQQAQTLRSMQEQFDAEEAALKTQYDSKAISEEAYGTSLLELDAKRQQLLASQESLSVSIQAGTEEEKKLGTEIALINEQIKLNQAKEAEIKLQAALDEAANSRLKSEMELGRIQAERANQREQARSGGVSESLIAEEDARQRINDLVAEYATMEDSISAKKAALNADENLPEETRLRLLNEIYAEETALQQKQAEVSSARFEANQLEFSNAQERANLLAQITTDEINAAYELTTAREQLNAEMRLSTEYGNELAAISDRTAASLNSIGLAKIDFDLGLLNEAQALSEKLAQGVDNPALQAIYKDRIELIKEATNLENIGLATELELLDQKDAKEKAAIQFKLDAALNQANLEESQATIKLSLIDLEISKEQTLLQIQKNKLQEEINILNAKQQRLGFLTQEESAAKNAAKSQIEKTDIVNQKLEVSKDNLKIQGEIIKKNAESTRTVANNEANHEKEVVTTNTTLNKSKAIEDGIVNSKQTKTAVEKQHGDVLDQNTAKAKQQRDAEKRTASFDGGNIYMDKQLKDFIKEAGGNQEYTGGFGGGRQGSMSEDNMNEWLRFSEAQQKAALVGELRYKEALAKAKKEFEDKALGRDREEGRTSSTFTQFQSSPQTYNIGKPQQKVEMSIAGAEILQQQLAALVALQERDPSERTLDVINLIKGQIDGIRSDNEQRFIDETSAGRIRFLANRKQTSDVRSAISKMADELIDSYSAANRNDEIAALASQLDTLIKTNGSEKQIIDLATQIKELNKLQEEQNKTTNQKLESDSLLDILKQGGFTEGEFKDTAGELFLDPKTKELILSGYKFSEETSQQLTELIKANDISTQQLVALNNLSTLQSSSANSITAAVNNIKLLPPSSTGISFNNDGTVKDSGTSSSGGGGPILNNDGMGVKQAATYEGKTYSKNLQGGLTEVNGKGSRMGAYYKDQNGTVKMFGNDLKIFEKIDSGQNILSSQWIGKTYSKDQNGNFVETNGNLPGSYYKANDGTMMMFGSSKKAAADDETGLRYGELYIGKKYARDGNGNFVENNIGSFFRDSSGAIQLLGHAGNLASPSLMSVATTMPPPQPPRISYSAASSGSGSGGTTTSAGFGGNVAANAITPAQMYANAQAASAQQITNNYYPTTSGTVNSQLRSAGL